MYICSDTHKGRVDANGNAPARDSSRREDAERVASQYSAMYEWRKHYNEGRYFAQ